MHYVIDYKKAKRQLTCFVSKLSSIQKHIHTTSQTQCGTDLINGFLYSFMYYKNFQVPSVLLPQNYFLEVRYVSKSCLHTATIRHLEDQHLCPLRDPCKRCAQNTDQINQSMKLLVLYKNIDTIHKTALQYANHPLSCLPNLVDSNLHPFNWNALKQIETICIYIARKGGHCSN